MAPTTAELAALLQSLTTPTPENASSISQTLYTHLQSTCIEPLSQILLTHPEAPVRNLAALLLRTHQAARLGELPSHTLANATKRFLERLSCEPHPATRRAIIALFTTLSFRDEKLILLLPPVVKALLSSPDPTFRAQAFLLPDVSPESLQKGLVDPDASVRHEALTAYANATLLPNPGFIQLLPSALKHTASTPVTDDAFPRVNALLYEALANLLQAQDFRPHFSDAFGHAVQTFSKGPVDAAGPAVEFLVYACEKKPRTIKKAGLHDIAITEACRILLTEPMDVRENNEDDTGRESRIFLAMRVLDALAMKPELSSAVFLQGYGTVVKSMADPNSRTLIGCYNIIAALSDGCSAEITSHAEEVVTRVLSPQYEDRMNADARSSSLDALTSVTKSLDTDEMPDEVTARIAEVSLASVVKGLRHQVLSVRRAACMSLEPVLGLFRSGELGGRAEEVVDALAALDGTLAVEAVLAIGVLAENASDALVASSRFQVLLRRTVEMMVNTSSDDSLTTAAAYEAAGALVTVCKDVDVVNRLAEHAVPSLDSDDPTVKQGALSFFANLGDSVGGSSVLVYGERVLKSAIQSVEQKDMFVVPDEDGTLTDMNGDEDDGREAHVRTAYLDEKMVAVGCIGAFATAAGSDEFINKFPSLSGSGSTILDLLGKAALLTDTLTTHFHSEIRAPAFRACCRLASANIRMRARNPDAGFCPPAYTDRVLSIVLEGLRDDDDLWVVTDLANAFSIYLADIPPSTVISRKEDIIETLDLLILGKAECQTQDDEEEDLHGDLGGDDLDSLIESIGDVIEALVRALRGHFAQHFTCLLEQILKTLYGPNHSGRSRGMVLGTIAGVLFFMCWERCPFAPPSMSDPMHELALSASDDLAAAAVPLALEASRTADSRTLQRNAVFLLGVIFEHTRSTKNDVWMHLPAALETMQQILFSEKTGNGALVDNAAGAISRIAIARGMPAGAACNRKTMLQAALGCVPLEDDPSENTTVARVLVQAAETGFDDLLQADIALRVVSCLVTAVLVHVETAESRLKSRWVNSGSDPNDEMVRLDDGEYAKIVKMLQRLRQVAGESVFAQLRLTEQDASVLAQVLSR